MDKINHIYHIWKETLRSNTRVIYLYGRTTINKLLLLMIIIQLIFLYYYGINFMMVLLVGFILSIICRIMYNKYSMISKLVRRQSFFFIDFEYLFLIFCDNFFQERRKKKSY